MLGDFAGWSADAARGFSLIMRTRSRSPRSWKPARTVVLQALIVVLASACCDDTPKDPCLPGGEPGKAYNVTLEELQPPNSQTLPIPQSCDAFDGLDTGVAFSIALRSEGFVRFSPDYTPSDRCVEKCRVHQADVVGLSDQVTIRPGQPDWGLDEYVDFAYFVGNVAIGGCDGGMRLTFRGNDRILVTRGLGTEVSATCNGVGEVDPAAGRAYCEDTWLGSLARP
jgi:hypothetical protein